jgi:hypothetical protein
MKLSAYVVSCDSGFAPNPFGRHCTLACCKPRIRLCAEKDDIVIGISSSSSETPGRLVYAMKVSEVLSYAEYWSDPRFAYRKPSPETPISRCGDNVWHRDMNGKWVIAPNDFHDMSNRRRDISGQNVLVAKEFYYFGEAAIPVSTAFKTLMHSGRGHKNTHDTEPFDRERIEHFWHWLGTVASKPGRIGDPVDFDGRSQCLNGEPANPSAYRDCQPKRCSS